MVYLWDFVSRFIAMPNFFNDNQYLSNADWTGDASDRRSHGGFTVYYGGNLVSWQSKKQAIVTRSSTEVEYKSLADATSEALWVSTVLQELGAPATTPTQSGAIARAQLVCLPIRFFTLQPNMWPSVTISSRRRWPMALYKSVTFRPRNSRPIFWRRHCHASHSDIIVTN